MADGADAQRACPVCLAPFAPDDPEDARADDAVVTTNCGHRYCAGCLRAAALRSPSCPLCRGEAHDCRAPAPGSCALCKAAIATSADHARRRAALPAADPPRARPSAPSERRGDDAELPDAAKDAAAAGVFVVLALVSRFFSMPRLFTVFIEWSPSAAMPPASP